MLLNVPNKIKKSDIKKQGEIELDNSKGFVLSNIDNTSSIPLVVNGYYMRVLTYLNSYLFLVSNATKTNYNLKVNKLDFVSAILRFEYMLLNSSKDITQITLKDNIFYVMSEGLRQTFNERCLQDDLTSLNIRDIKYIIEHNKMHLKAFETPLERYIRYLCDDVKDDICVTDNTLVINTYFSNKINVLKDSGINGYIIKYNEIE